MDFLSPLEGDIQGDTQATMKDVGFFRRGHVERLRWGGLQWEYISQTRISTKSEKIKQESPSQAGSIRNYLGKLALSHKIFDTNQPNQSTNPPKGSFVFQYQ